MSPEPLATLHEVDDLLASFEKPSDIRRAAELAGAAEKVVACAAQLVDVPDAEDLQRRLAFAVRAIRAAEKAGRAHRRNPLTRPFSHARFALRTGSSRGWIQTVMRRLDPEYTPPDPTKSA